MKVTSEWKKSLTVVCPNCCRRQLLHHEPADADANYYCMNCNSVMLMVVDNFVLSDKQIKELAKNRHFKAKKIDIESVKRKFSSKNATMKIPEAVIKEEGLSPSDIAEREYHKETEQEREAHSKEIETISEIPAEVANNTDNSVTNKVVDQNG